MNEERQFTNAVAREAGKGMADTSRDVSGLSATVAALIRERDAYKALASVGTWHNECRPNRWQAAEEIQKSQQRIDTLAADVARLSAALQQAQTPNKEALYDAFMEGAKVQKGGVGPIETAFDLWFQFWSKA